MLVVRSGTVLPSETGRQRHGNMSMNKRTNTFKTSVKSHECCPLCSAIKATLLVLIMHVDRAGGMNGPQEENQLCPVCVNTSVLIYSTSSYWTQHDTNIE